MPVQRVKAHISGLSSIFNGFSFRTEVNIDFSPQKFFINSVIRFLSEILSE